MLRGARKVAQISTSYAWIVGVTDKLVSMVKGVIMASLDLYPFWQIFRAFSIVYLFKAKEYQRPK